MMLCRLPLARCRVNAFAPFLRSFSTNFPKPVYTNAKKLLESFRAVVLSTRNSSSRNMHVTDSSYMTEKFYDQIVRQLQFPIIGSISLWCVVRSRSYWLWFLLTYLSEKQNSQKLQKIMSLITGSTIRYNWLFCYLCKHPITRFMARYLMWSPQQVYENNLAYRKRVMDAKALV